MARSKETLSLVPLPIDKVGYQRDGTAFAAAGGVISGKHMRWHNGRFMKIGGYELLSQSLTAPVRQIQGFWAHTGGGYLHLGSSSKLEQVFLNLNGAVSAPNDRTPLTGFTASSNNQWQFGIMYDAVTTDATIVAQCTANLADIGAGAYSDVYFGPVNTSTPLVPISATTPNVAVDGGICVIQPYLFLYGSDGYVTWSAPNSLTDFSTINGGGGVPPAGARIAGSKILRGYPARGANSGPTGYFWAIDSFIRATYVGGDAIWSFQTISDKTSVLSTSGIVEADGRFFWPALDRFVIYDGSLRELRNTYNFDWFFDNLNMTWRQKCWGIFVPRFGEIWWFFPFYPATECTHAIIYNIRENAWYDTELARTAGWQSRVFSKPVMTSNATSPAYLWRQETGHDQVMSGVSTAIEAEYETYPMSLSRSEDSGVQSHLIYLDSVEPDMIQVGDVTMTVEGEEYARSTQTSSLPYTITDTTDRVDVREQFRHMRIRMNSNTVGGFMEMGRTLLRMRPGDGQ